MWVFLALYGLDRKIQFNVNVNAILQIVLIPLFLFFFFFFLFWSFSPGYLSFCCFRCSFSWAIFNFDINCVELYSQLPIISIQFNRIGIENTVDINKPLLSKYCWRENVVQCRAANSLIYSEKYTNNTAMIQNSREKKTPVNDYYYLYVMSVCVCVCIVGDPP